MGFNFTGDMWLQDKQDTDGAEGLWRIENELYDFTPFINKHPGGQDWLALTKVKLQMLRFYNILVRQLFKEYKLDIRSLLCGFFWFIGLN